jgi:hypothetical protein
MIETPENIANLFPIQAKRKSRNSVKLFNIVVSDFKSEVGEIADIVSFQKEFLGRNIEGLQKECYEEVWGTKGGEWSTKYSEIVLLIGMKGGKNFWAEGDVAYTCYFISSLKDPHAYFSKITKRPVPYTLEKTFDIVNVSAVDEAQARRAFFDSVKNILKTTKDPKTKENWFERYAGLDLREQHGDFTKKEVVFPTRGSGVGGIRLLSFNSTSTAPEGVHILRFYADELSRASTKATYREAKALLELGLNNTSASFPNKVGKVLEWSYPNDSDYDLTQERYELSLKTEGIFGRKYKTYEFNPSLTREMLEDRFKADPITAKRVYECEKSISKTNFFQPYANKLDEMIDPNLENKVEYKIITTSKEAGGKSYEFTTAKLISIKGDNKKRCFSIDPAKTKDRFVILGGYVETINELKLDLFVDDNYEVVATNVKPIIDIAIVIEPKEGKPIDYVEIGNLFAQLIKAFPNIVSINSDHFQNEKFRQEILAKGIRSETYFFSNQKQVQLYTLLRGNVWNNNIKFLKDTQKYCRFGEKELTINELMLEEAKALQDLGGKVDHPSWGSKDVIDSLAILNHDLMQLETSENNEDLFNDEKIQILIARYFEERSRIIEEDSDVPEVQLNNEIQKRMNLSDKQMKNFLEYFTKNA